MLRGDHCAYCKHARTDHDGAYGFCKHDDYCRIHCPHFVEPELLRDFDIEELGEKHGEEQETKVRKKPPEREKTGQ